MSRFVSAALILCFCLALIGCGGEKPNSVQEPETQSVPLAPSLVAGLAPELTSYIESQKWLITQRGLRPLAAIRRAAITSESRQIGQSGELRILQAVGSKTIYSDGLDKDEALTLAALFNAYADLTQFLPAIDFTSGFEQAVQAGWSRVILLPESGPRALIGLGSKDSEHQVREAMRLVEDIWPEVESLVGPYAYGYLVVRINSNLPAGFAAVSYGSLIDVRPEAVDRSVMIHELAHSSLGTRSEYWFVEGVAHFIEAYLQNSVEAYSRSFELFLERQQQPRRIQSIHPVPYRPGLVERAQGFLLIRDVYDVAGLDTLRRAIRSLRGNYLNEYEVMLALQYYAPDAVRTQLNAVLCDLSGRPSAYAQYQCRDVPNGAAASITRRPSPEVSPGIPLVRQALLRQGFAFSNGKTPRDYLTHAVVRAAENALATSRPTANVIELWDTVFERPWAKDGLDERELRSLTVIFNAYADALTRLWEPEPTAAFRQIIQLGLFRSIEMPETDQAFVLAMASMPENATRALKLVATQLPQVEALVGPYPAPFVLVRVNDSANDGPDVTGGREFIDIKLRALEGPLLTRELARSTLTGKYDAWFREGVVEAIAVTISGTKSAYVDLARQDLLAAGVPERPTPDFRGLNYQPTATERLQFTLFILGITDAIGLDGLSRVTRRVKGNYETTFNLINFFCLQAYTRASRVELSNFLSCAPR